MLILSIVLLIVMKSQNKEAGNRIQKQIGNLETRILSKNEEALQAKPATETIE